MPILTIGGLLLISQLSKKLGGKWEEYEDVLLIGYAVMSVIIVMFYWHYSHFVFSTIAKEEVLRASKEGKPLLCELDFWKKAFIRDYELVKIDGTFYVVPRSGTHKGYAFLTTDCENVER